jgi:hypothetical protein
MGFISLHFTCLHGLSAKINVNSVIISMKRLLICRMWTFIPLSPLSLIPVTSHLIVHFYRTSLLCRCLYFIVIFW